ncbi:hypothetical protein FV219_00375 [Methylobacterium sp. WL122]|nr:hypothetical protein FV219_00375 [Methylobacterium sp. WL122]
MNAVIIIFLYSNLSAQAQYEFQNIPCGTALSVSEGIKLISKIPDDYVIKKLFDNHTLLIPWLYTRETAERLNCRGASNHIWFHFWMPNLLPPSRGTNPAATGVEKFRPTDNRYKRDDVTSYIASVNLEYIGDENTNNVYTADKMIKSVLQYLKDAQQVNMPNGLVRINSPIADKANLAYWYAVDQDAQMLFRCNKHEAWMVVEICLGYVYFPVQKIEATVMLPADGMVNSKSIAGNILKLLEIWRVNK